MIQDVYEPLAAYRDEFQGKFARLTREKFKDLTRRSGIDVAANRTQVKVIGKLDRARTGAQGKRAFYGLLMSLGYLGGIVCFGILLLNDAWANDVRLKMMLGGVLVLAFGIWMTVLFSGAGDLVRQLETRLAAAKKKAWEQMAALNRLYTWDITTKLIEATVPRLAFDPFFTAKRLRDLKRLYGWDDAFNTGKSILFAQSGVINGNPFLIGAYREMKWGTETYEGSKEISWTEWERGADGKNHRVTRHETLYASVTKPKPVYSTDKILIYGNDAAPNLKFSRVPSGFDDDDWLDGIRKRWRLHKLKAKSRNLNDRSDFTLMANHAFETWFNAADRDNEVEFRLLFTALAQTQMMALLQDRAVGFGDDFTFRKDHKLNYILPRHLRDAEIDTNPTHFHHWDYERAAETFRNFNEKYFRDVYFALAPLLAIPLYQQTRTHEEIWKDVLGADGASFWEHEAIANCYGDDRFKHPACVTQNILKTEVVHRADGVSEVEVTAHGYRGAKRVERVEVFGGDGEYHLVPVEWVEYIPVEKATAMLVSESPTPHAAFAADYNHASAALFRRSIRSYVAGDR